MNESISPKAQLQPDENNQPSTSDNHQSVMASLITSHNITNISNESSEPEIVEVFYRSKDASATNDKQTPETKERSPSTQSLETSQHSPQTNLTPEPTESTQSPSLSHTLQPPPSSYISQPSSSSQILKETPSSFFPEGFKMGKFIPIIKKNDVADYSLDIEPDDAILECPSLVTPLLIKKANTWPPEVELDHNEVATESNSQNKQNSHQNISGKITNDLVRATTVASLTNPHQIRPILAIPDYYRSSVGSFLMSLGVSMANEWIIKDNIKKTQRAIRKEDNPSDFIVELEAQNEQLRQTVTNNKPFTFSLIQCPHCEFKTESSIVLEGHMTYPHVTPKREYKCNWCDLKTKDAKQITFHNHLVHRRRCYIDPPMQLHECVFCPYESNSKAKSLTHIARCQKTFCEARNQGTYDESDFPAVTSKFINKGDIKIYEETLQAIRLAAYNPNQHKLPGPSQVAGRQSLLVVPRSASNQSAGSNTNYTEVSTNQDSGNGINGNQSLRIIGGKLGQNVAAYLSSNYPRRPPSNSVPMISTLPGSSAQLLQMFAPSKNIITKSGNLNILQHPKVKPSNFNNAKSLLSTSASLMMPPKSSNLSPQTSLDKIVPSNKSQNLNESLLVKNSDPNVQISIMNNNSHLSASKNATFVICEICDGYIKDLEQLKTHMQWIHKVKIHQKMLESRPPLNCQKCQWRFFTDQGLERHLLGAHGLVTSNMQEQVEQNTDSGRCTVCGRAYASKLVQHMKEVHKSNLKPAHLSYKCTVCAATFNLYRLFENHVYSVHSDSVKRSSSDTDVKNSTVTKKTKVDFPKNASVAAVNAVIADRQNDANSNNIQATA